MFFMMKMNFMEIATYVVALTVNAFVKKARRKSNLTEGNCMGILDKFFMSLIVIAAVLLVREFKHWLKEPAVGGGQFKTDEASLETDVKKVG